MNLVVLSMNVMKYFAPDIDGIENGPHRSKCTNCNGSVVLVLLGENDLCDIFP